MANLKAIEIKAFIPAKDYALSKRFYSDLGFVEKSDLDGIAHFHCGEATRPRTRLVCACQLRN